MPEITPAEIMCRLALMVLPTLVVGNEMLILGGVAAAVALWFLAHRHGKLQGFVVANKNGVDALGGIEPSDEMACEPPGCQHWHSTQKNLNRGWMRLDCGHSGEPGVGFG